VFSDEVIRAINHADILTFRRVLEDGLDPNVENGFGWTLLMHVALKGNVPMGKLLISKGADPRFKNSWGGTAEWCAQTHGHVRFVEQVLARPAS
jgi:ankyrin repeat protein